MIQWTTQSLKCTIPETVNVDYLILSLKQGDILLEKTINASEIEEGVFDVSFTQEETGWRYKSSNKYS